MTPDQTAVILEEHVAMNKTDQDPTEVGLDTMQVAIPQATPVDSELGQRVKAEMAASIAASRAASAQTSE